jgi:hypothetical protein
VVVPDDSSSDPRSMGAAGADKAPAPDADEGAAPGADPALGGGGEPAGALPVVLDGAAPPGAVPVGAGVPGAAPESVSEGGAVPVPLPGDWASAGAERANRTSNIDVDEEQRMREL